MIKLHWQGSKGKFQAQYGDLQFLIHSYDSLPFNTRIIWVLEMFDTIGNRGTTRQYRTLKGCKAAATRLAKRGTA